MTIAPGFPLWPVSHRTYPTLTVSHCYRTTVPAVSTRGTGPWRSRDGVRSWINYRSFSPSKQLQVQHNCLDALSLIWVFLKNCFNTMLILGCAESPVLWWAICALVLVFRSLCSDFSISERRLQGSTAAEGAAPALICPAASGIFPDQGSNLRPLCWQVAPLSLGHQGSPVSVLTGKVTKCFERSFGETLGVMSVTKTRKSLWG